MYESSFLRLIMGIFQCNNFLVNNRRRPLAPAYLSFDARQSFNLGYTQKISAEIEKDPNSFVLARCQYCNC